MTPERWQQVDEIFQAAIELNPVERVSFLEASCAGDEELRREVESLITSDEQGWSVIDSPAYEVAAGLLLSETPELQEGYQISHYRIVSLLGSGGMGEVYLAQDTTLGRQVALKLLPSEFTGNVERLRRFQQEARAVSALNHPNILTLHEISYVEDRHFIATEFVDGETLRQRLRRSRLDLPEVVDIAIQVAGALSAAHDAGIVHRDIKPENIMLRRDGYVKVLDFGLAKLAEQKEQLATSDVPAERLDASSGLLMGTVKYMSPEQARGGKVDVRSDIFSFAVVLYEMIAGHAPFEGETSERLITAISKEEPLSLTECGPDVPEGFQRVTAKALRKEKKERYQTVEELLIDLKSLKQELKLESNFHHPAARNNTAETTSTSSKVEYLTEEIKRHKLGATLALAAVLIVLMGGGFAVYRFIRGKKAGIPFQIESIAKLTNFGDAWSPAISPDGKYVVYAKGWGTEGPGKFSLWRRAVGMSTEVQLVPPTEIDGWFGGTTFSPDGGYVTYWVSLKNQPRAIYTVPLSGGDPKKLPLKNAVPISFSPDGKRLAYFANRLSEGKTVLVVANADGTDERDVNTRQAPNYYRTAIKPSWSPDGKLIACVGQNGNESFPHVFEVNIETRTERPVTTQRWTAIRDVVWLPDMNGLLIAAAGETSSIYQIWQLSYPDGRERRVTNDTVSYWDLDLTADGRTLVAQKVEAPTSFWVMPVEDSHRMPAKDGLLSVASSSARQINTSTISSGENDGIAWTPDGRIVYVSEESGNADLWSMNADGGDPKQLTSDPHRDAAPNVSADGRYIAFVSTRADGENIWIMNIDGSNQRRLTSKLIERQPVFSADNKWVYFVSWQTGKGTIWRIPVEGGEPNQVISDLSFAPAISPDGKLLAYQTSGKVFIVPAEGGPPIKSFDAPGKNYQWAPDGRALTFLWYRANWPNLWAQPLAGGAPQQLTNYTSSGIFLYAWSRDGRQFAEARHTLPSDLVLIREGR